MSHPIVPELRIPNFSYQDMPEDWVGGNPLASCFGNALHMVFPAGERFFVRSVMHFKEQLQNDPELWRRVRGFAGQEGQHGYQHERVFDVLRRQGVPVDPYLKRYEAFAFGFLEKYIGTPKLKLSTTVAAEHLTATLARLAIEHDIFTKMSDEMGDLLRWHALEELEHQHVTWEVMQQIDDGYALRIAGLALISAVLFPFWFGGGAYLAWSRKEPLLSLLRRSAGVRDTLPLGALVGALAEYLKPDYTPGKPGDDELLERMRRWFEQAQPKRAAAAA